MQAAACDRDSGERRLTSQAESTPPPVGTCQYTVARTLDGGISWFEPVPVGPLYSASAGGAPRAMQFLNRSDGFVWGDAAAFVTHDGGDHWAGAGLAYGLVYSIAGRGDSAWAVTLPCDATLNSPCPALVHYAVQWSGDGGRSWASPRLLPHFAGTARTIAFGSNGLLVWGASVIEMTTDGGATWRSISTKCGGALASTDDVATSDGREIWNVCTGLVYSRGPNVAPDIVIKGPFISEDGGLSWSETSRPPTVFGEGALMSLVSPAKGTAFITSLGTTTIYVTRDAGRTWKPVAVNGTVPANGFFSIRFGAGTDLWAIGFGFQMWVWASHDRGETWSMVPDPRVYTNP